MTNKQKAKDITKCLWFPQKCTECDIQNMLIQMAEWKDEQFQKVLDYAEICYGVFSFEQRENFINHIKDIFYGKE